MVGSMTAFTINDAYMKLLGEGLPLFQVLFLRGLGVLAFLWWLTWARGQIRWQLPRRDWALIATRSVAEGFAVWLFMKALFAMDIANVSAILQALPLTVTLAGALVLGEAVGWRRLSAIMIGFCGVMLIVQPGAEGFDWNAMYAVAAVVAVTIRDLAARRLSAAVPSLMVSLMAAVTVLVVSAVGTAFEPWVAVSGQQWLWLGGAMVFIVGGYIFSVSAMRVGEIGFVAPFRYTSLVVAMILGVVVFGTFPDGWTLVGAAIVVSTGLYTLLREWQLKR